MQFKMGEEKEGSKSDFLGRPRMFKSVDEFKDRAKEYFQSKEPFKDDDGKTVYPKVSWTGLCLAVGASSRSGLDRYRNGEHGKEFVAPIKKALMMIESYYEENGTGHAGKDVFILKNFDWKDTQTQTLVHEAGKVSGKANDLLDNLSSESE